VPLAPAHARSSALPLVFVPRAIVEEITEDKAGAVVTAVGGIAGREIGGWVADSLGLPGLAHMISEAFGGAATGWGARRLYRRLWRR
jgi:uncharacterized membrane protein YeaQ/YmgE (transglycosylase-associated protein family)